MGNINEKTISAILARIDNMREELSLLEEEVKALAVSPEPEIEEPAPEPIAVPEPLEAPEPVEVAVEPEPVLEPEVAVEPEPVVEPEAPVEEPIDIAPVDDSPIDISISDLDMPADIPATPLPKQEENGKMAIMDVAKADTAVMDVMEEKQAWRTDRPGMPVKNIISAISLNDRVLLINVLFGEDPMLFQETISKFNAMGSLSEALAYISENHPDWDMNSEPVYRLMMAVRRKLS